MPRSTNSVYSRRKRKKILKLAKGFYGARSKVYTIAKNAVEKSFSYAFSGRKKKKKYFKSLWIQRINAGSRRYGISYSKFMKKLSDKSIKINRKFLSDFSMNHPDVFKKIVDYITL
ncbi:50S ribosomal protein L20 [Blattabacterium clevelandi]|uniref:50S ribosomal protein L20 n=1 Tax=Blattabacterium clevelandi TaxID=164516 RepID=UPI000DE5B08A|nr:50S ribosomal protein L20 [Blattabacterium clevelandi]